MQAEAAQAQVGEVPILEVPEEPVVAELEEIIIILEMLVLIILVAAEVVPEVLPLIQFAKVVVMVEKVLLF
jgi:hypothetical protein